MRQRTKLTYRYATAHETRHVFCIQSDTGAGAVRRATVKANAGRGTAQCDNNTTKT